MSRSALAATGVGTAALAALAALASPALATTSADSIRYTTRVITTNPVFLAISNYGVIGNNFVSRSPSMEYPGGLGYEHLTHGGLWVGAHAVDAAGAFTGVTTGALDQNPGIPTEGLTEFTPAGLEFELRSSRVSSPYYSPDAVSELDAIAEFSDRPARTTSGNPEPHRPMGLLVRQEAYSWSSAGYGDFIVLHEMIRNIGDAPLTDVWVGLYTEFASGPKNACTGWPPNSSVCWFGSWFSKKLLGWDDGLRLLREHRCDGYPIPEGCHFGITPAWAGMVLLTPPASGQQVTLAAWDWSPGNSSRDQDFERYALMSAGTIQDLSVPELMPVTGDPTELLAVGPFTTLAPGESLVVDFALVGGAEEADIQQHTRSAQVLHDAGYAIDLVGVEPGSEADESRLAPLGNPQRAGRVRISFRLSGGAPATLELVDLQGRRVVSREVGGFGRGRHVLNLDPDARLRSGVYFARLTEGEHVARAKVLVIQ